MSKRAFNQIAFDIDLSKKLQYGSLPINNLYEIMKDARITGILVEHLISHSVPGLQIAKTKGDSYDLFDASSRRLYECKTTAANGWSVQPSYMKGASRVFDLAKVEEWIQTIDGIILCHVGKFPLLEFATLRLPEDKALINFTKAGARVSKKVWEELRAREQVKKFTA